jgi:hypothetical protein
MGLDGQGGQERRDGGPRQESASTELRHEDCCSASRRLLKRAKSEGSAGRPTPGGSEAFPGHYSRCPRTPSAAEVPDPGEDASRRVWPSQGLCSSAKGGTDIRSAASRRCASNWTHRGNRGHR